MFTDRLDAEQPPSVAGGIEAFVVQSWRGKSERQCYFVRVKIESLIQSQHFGYLNADEFRDQMYGFVLFWGFSFGYISWCYLGNWAEVHV